MTPNARWPSVVEEMPGREFHVTGFQRVGWREKSSFNTFFHHIAAPCQGILSILEVFFCLIARTLYILKKCNTSLLFCDSRCHRLGSSVYKPSTDFGSIDAKHGQGVSRSRLRFQHGGGIHDDRARIQVSRKALSCLLLIAFTAGRITGNIVYVLNPASPVQVFDCFVRPLLGGLSFMPFLRYDVSGHCRTSTASSKNQWAHML